MKSRPVVPGRRARRDVDQAIEQYVTEGGAGAALAFIQALEEAYGHIARFPASGSTRIGHELELPGLRSWPLTAFPYVVFYVEREDRIDVWRVLHSRRDIPTWLQV